MPGISPTLGAVLGTGFTFLLTCLGAALVFFFKKQISGHLEKFFLGFASGVMIAASVWSLLIPAIEESAARSQIAWIPAAGGFLIGALFLLGLDTLTPHLHAGSDHAEGRPSGMKRTSLLFSAVTLHNIPEGMAVGLAFALAAQHSGKVTYLAAMALALGIGIQNFPEGAAISLPLRQEGMSRSRAFSFGVLSGVVEPIFGVLTVWIAGGVEPLMPWMLSFAAGAMIYVVADELIPGSHEGEHSNWGTIGVITGFLIMMILDVALG
jgi:zinc transporter, ZIP family